MVTNSELARYFSNGATKGTGSNMFIEGEAIYSYGYHFPIAFRLRDGSYLFNGDKYSSSTSKHQSYVWSAVGGNITTCTTQEIKQAMDNPESPVVLVRTVQHTEISECFANIKEILRGKGMKRAPIKKWITAIHDWELLRSI